MPNAESHAHGHDYLKGHTWEVWRALESDQRRGLPAPPLEKPYPADAILIDLPSPRDLTLGRMPLIEAIASRRSRRRFSPEALTLEELSFLLWATQGVVGIAAGGHTAWRTVPSAGSRHPFETYLFINRVQQVGQGLYRYLPFEHQLCFLRAEPQMGRAIGTGCNGQTFAGTAAVTFIWTAIPYRTEWRYGPISPKLIALDAGHLCQNLYLAAEAIGGGACAIAAYQQAALDAVLGVDGVEEFTVYVAPVGKIKDIEE